MAEKERKFLGGNNDRRPEQEVKSLLEVCWDETRNYSSPFGVLCEGIGHWGDFCLWSLRMPHWPLTASRGESNISKWSPSFVIRFPSLSSFLYFLRPSLSDLAVWRRLMRVLETTKLIPSNLRLDSLVPVSIFTKWGDFSRSIEPSRARHKRISRVDEKREKLVWFFNHY